MTKEQHICEFCNKSFTTKGSLKHHMNTTRKCLEIQGIENHSIECNFCKLKFPSILSLNFHKKNDPECLKIQADNKNLYSCDNCFKHYVSKRAYATHIKHCSLVTYDKEYYIVKLKESEESNRKLREYMEKCSQHTKKLEDENKVLRSVIKIKKDKLNNLPDFNNDFE